MKQSSLRMKIRNYEDIYRISIKSELPIIIRVDGRAFHSLTRQFKRPWDLLFMDAMNNVALRLAEQVSSAVISYVQSDEVTVISIPYAKENTEPWFGGGVQKICSTSACIATLAFNAKMLEHGYQTEGMFDSRVFTVPKEKIDLVLIDRQEDCIRNSILSLSQSVFGKKKIYGKKRDELLLDLEQHGSSWHNYDEKFRYGRIAVKVPRQVEIPEKWRKKDGPSTIDRMVFEIQTAPNFQKEMVKL